MPGFEHGFIRALKEVIGGLIISSIFNYFFTYCLKNPILVLAINPPIAISIALIVNNYLPKMRYWGTKYLLGWLSGYVLVTQLGLISPGTLIVYITIALLILLGRE